MKTLKYLRTSLLLLKTYYKLNNRPPHQNKTHEQTSPVLYTPHKQLWFVTILSPNMNTDCICQATFTQKSGCISLYTPENQVKTSQLTRGS